MEPGRLDIRAPRWAPFNETWTFEGEDWTGASFALQVRLVRDEGGAALIDLATVVSASAQGVRIVYAGTDTVANHIAADRIEEIPEGLTSASNFAVTMLGVRINKSAMVALPFRGERGADTILAWDIHVTPAGGTEIVPLGGDFIVLAGATQ